MSGRNASFNLDPASAAELNRAVAALAEIAGKTVEKEIPNQARLLCVDLAYNTKPIGKGNKGQITMLKNRIEAKIKSIYLPISSAVAILKEKDVKQAQAFRRLLRGHQYTQATAVFNKWACHHVRIVRFGTFDQGQLHKSQQFGVKVKEGMIVSDYPAVKKYITAKKKLIGFAKGGFSTAAKQLGGTRGIPGFASRQNSPGTGSVTGDGKNLTVTITNDVRYIRDALDAGAEGRALAFRKKQVESVIQRIMDRKLKNASRSLR